MKLNEIWKDIPQYEGEYQASNFGRIRSLKYGKERILKPVINRRYFFVHFSKDGKKKNFYVHSLVFSSFHGPIPSGMQVNHINENKLDNRLENLEILTPKQNSNHGTRNERVSKALKGKKFSAEHKAKLSAAQKARRLRERTGISTL